MTEFWDAYNIDSAVALALFQHDQKQMEMSAKLVIHELAKSWNGGGSDDDYDAGNAEVW